MEDFHYIYSGYSDSLRYDDIDDDATKPTMCNETDNYITLTF